MTDGRSEPGKPGDAGPFERVAQADWEKSPRPTSTAATPALVVDGIEAPLDWLVAQVRAGRLDLASLSIVALVEAFVNALDTALATAERRPSDFARWGAWLVMAADLALLRSQLLAPSTPQAAQDAGETAEALRRQVARRAEAAALADWLEHRQQLGASVWRTGQPEVRGAGGRGGDVAALFRGCLPALRVAADAEHAFRRAAAPVWSVADALARIRALLPDVAQGGAAMERFLPEVAAGGPDHALRRRAAVASTFSAALEMAREGAITVSQDSPFGSVMMDRALARSRPLHEQDSPVGDTR